MIEIKHLGYLQREALREAARHGGHTLVRVGRFYEAPPPPRGASGSVLRFTYRLMRMLERDGLGDFDNADLPTRFELSAHARALAQQLLGREGGTRGVA